MGFGRSKSVAFLLLVIGFSLGCGDEYPKQIEVRAREQVSVPEDLSVAKAVAKRGGVSIQVERILYNGEGSYTAFVAGKEETSLEPMQIPNDKKIKIFRDVEPGVPMRVDYYSRGNAVEIHIHSAQDIGTGGWIETVGSGKDAKHYQRQTNSLE